MNFFEMLDRISGNWSKDDLNISFEFAQEKGKIDDWVNNVIERLFSIVNNWISSVQKTILDAIPKNSYSVLRYSPQETMKYFNRNYSLYKYTLLNPFYEKRSSFKPEEKINYMFWISNHEKDLVSAIETIADQLESEYLIPQDDNIPPNEAIKEAINKIFDINQSCKKQLEDLLTTVHFIILNKIYVESEYEELQKIVQEQPSILRFIDNYSRGNFANDILLYLSKQTIAKFNIYNTNFGPEPIKEVLIRISRNLHFYPKKQLIDLLEQIKIYYGQSSNPLRKVYDLWKEIIEEILPGFNR